MSEESTNPLSRIQSVDFFHGAAGYMSITQKGVVVRGTLTFEEWRLGLYCVLWLREQFSLASSDLLGHGRREYGDVLVEEALEQMEFPLNDVKRADAISKVPWIARDEELTSEHYYVAGAAPDLTPEKREQWLKTAAAEKLTPLELKRSIFRGQSAQHAEDTPAGKGADSGIVTIQGVRMLFLQWRRENEERILTGPIDTQRLLLAEIEPFATWLTACAPTSPDNDSMSFDSNPQPDPSPFYTTEEAAAYFRVCTKTVLNMVKRGALRSVPGVRKHRFLKTEVHALTA